jgi:hypothetical protein
VACWGSWPRGRETSCCCRSTSPLSHLASHPCARLPSPHPPDSINSVISFMVGRLEGAFRELMEDDLTMYPPAKWKVRRQPGWRGGGAVTKPQLRPAGR